MSEEEVNQHLNIHDLFPFGTSIPWKWGVPPDPHCYAILYYYIVSVRGKKQNIMHYVLKKSIVFGKVREEGSLLTRGCA